MTAAPDARGEPPRRSAAGRSCRSRRATSARWPRRWTARPTRWCSTSRTPSSPAARTAPARCSSSGAAVAARRAVGRVTVRVNPPRLAVVRRGRPGARRPAGRCPARSCCRRSSRAGDLAFVDRLLDGAEARSGRSRRRWACRRSSSRPPGWPACRDRARRASGWRRCVLGYADLAASLGIDRRPPSGGRRSGCPCSRRVLVAARAAGLAAVDGPHLGVARRRRPALGGRAARPRPRLRRQVGDPPAPGRRAERGLHARPTTSSSTPGRCSTRSTGCARAAGAGAVAARRPDARRGRRRRRPPGPGARGGARRCRAVAEGPCFDDLAAR